MKLVTIADHARLNWRRGIDAIGSLGCCSSSLGGGLGRRLPNDSRNTDPVVGQ